MLFSSRKPSNLYYWFLGLLIVYLLLAFYLSYNALGKRFNTEEELIYDIMALDFWGLMFALVVVAVYMLRASARAKSAILIAVVSVYGAAQVLILLSGTDFAFKGFWGDQEFRTVKETHYSKIG